MTQEEIRENNKIIAEYMNYLNSSNSPYFYAMKHCYDHSLMTYHSSWDWLMPVVKKLNETTLFGVWTKVKYRFEIHDLCEALLKGDIIKAYEQVVTIIKKEKERQLKEELQKQL